MHYSWNFFFFGAATILLKISDVISDAYEICIYIKNTFLDNSMQTILCYPNILLLFINEYYFTYWTRPLKFMTMVINSKRKWILF